MQQLDPHTPRSRLKLAIPFLGKDVPSTASEFAQRCAQLGVEIAGAKSTLYKLDAAAPKGGHWPLATMASYGNTIAGGSNEILRNILGERILGLAKTK